jgi:elongation factor P
MASTSDIRNGLCIFHNHDTWAIVEFQHVKPGKGAAFVRTKLKSFTTGRVLEQTFPSGHKIEEVNVERRQFQYLYNDETGLNFMDLETYDQVSVKESFVDGSQFLKEGMQVQIIFNATSGVALIAEMPQKVTLKVTYTEPGVKGDTATNTLKPATVETGAEVRVPLFIGDGDYIIVSTADGKYVERTKAPVDAK